MSFRIRPIEAGDLEIVRAVVSSYAEELARSDQEAAEQLRHEAEDDLCSFPQIRKRYFQSGGTLMVMTDRDRIIGLGGVRRSSPDICELHLLVFMRAFRGRGLGHEMALSLIEWARDNDYGAMRLEVSRRQTDAVKLFSQLRFVALETASSSSHHGPEELTYELDLRRKSRLAL
ncbi:GNAT family N-acetyltransferase [bacterium]|nr:MAG: GNAT family N-acetyltransferase [bacterium]